MSSIDRIQAQDAARTYIQNTDAARSAGASVSAQQPDRAESRRQTQVPKADSVTLSASARSLAAAREAVQSAPDVREAKVAEIKQRVEDGTYHVPANVLARNIVDATQTPS